jgi:hypothetical protein
VVELYFKVGNLQASHASPTSDGTKAARYPGSRRFIAPTELRIVSDCDAVHTCLD